MNQIINVIHERDRVFGKLCQEAEESYRNENYFSAIACLFVIAEQITKYSLDKNDGDFYKSLLEAKERKIINKDEFVILDSLRDFRNKVFHENHYSLGLVLEGKIFPVDEDETKKIIYEKFAESLFGIVLKIIRAV